jgi:hypothetical protein
MKKLDEKLAALEKVKPVETKPAETKPAETKGGAVKKAKGRPMKMRFIAGSKDENEKEEPVEKKEEKPAEVKKEEPKRDVVGDVKKVVNIALKRQRDL